MSGIAVPSGTQVASPQWVGPIGEFQLINREDKTESAVQVFDPRMAAFDQFLRTRINQSVAAAVQPIADKVDALKAENKTLKREIVIIKDKEYERQETKIALMGISSWVFITNAAFALAYVVAATNPFLGVVIVVLAPIVGGGAIVGVMEKLGPAEPFRESVIVDCLEKHPGKTRQEAIAILVNADRDARAAATAQIKYREGCSPFCQWGGPVDRGNGVFNGW